MSDTTAGAGEGSGAARFTWADGLFLILGFGCALYGAGRGAQVDGGDWSPLPYWGSLLAGLGVAAVWSWLTWFRGAPPKRTAKSEKRRQAMMVAAPFLGVVGLLLTRVSDAAAAVTFAFIGGYLIAALGMFGIHRVRARG